MTGSVLVCPDKFRGSATAAQAAAYLADGLRVHHDGPLHLLPIADGGEGTVDCCAAAGYDVAELTVTGPLGAPTRARFARRDEVAVLEAAQACGLDRFGPSAANALTATTRGVGELIAHVLRLGCREIVVGIGGTASTDGGAGLLQALGAELTDSDGAPIGPGGGGLAELARADLDRLDPRLGGATILVATDVDNPLLGTRGAARVFGPQKGVDPDELGRLDAGLRRLSGLVGAEFAERPGAGAGGGLGYALLAIGGRRVSGAETVLDLLGFDRALADARLVVTGEGSFDESSLGGKAPAVVAARAARRHVPVTLVAGRCSVPESRWRDAGIDTVHQLVDRAASPEESMSAAPRLLVEVGECIGAGLGNRSSGGTAAAT